VEIENLGPRVAVGHIRHQIDAARLRGIQAGLPFAGHGHQGPAFPVGDLAQQITQDAGRLAVCTEHDLGFVGVDAHPHLARLSGAQATQACQQAQHTEGPNGGIEPANGGGHGPIIAPGGPTMCT
jgi:hypothetical protein